MTSSDIEIFKSGLDDLKFYIDTRISDVNKQLGEIKIEIRTINDNVLVNSAKIDAQRDFMSIGLVVITLVGFIVTLAPMFRDFYRDAKTARYHDDKLTVEKVQLMIDEAIAKNLNNSRYLKSKECELS